MGAFWKEGLRKSKREFHHQEYIIYSHINMEKEGLRKSKREFHHQEYIIYSHINMEKELQLRGRGI
jgi:hypothetical protein